MTGNLRPTPSLDSLGFQRQVTESSSRSVAEFFQPTQGSAYYIRNLSTSLFRRWAISRRDCAEVLLLPAVVHISSAIWAMCSTLRAMVSVALVCSRVAAAISRVRSTERFYSKYLPMALLLLVEYSCYLVAETLGLRLV